MSELWSWSFVVVVLRAHILKEGRGEDEGDVARGPPSAPLGWGCFALSCSSLLACGCRGASERDRAGGDVAAGSGVAHLGYGPSPIFVTSSPSCVVVFRCGPSSLALLWLSIVVVAVVPVVVVVHAVRPVVRRGRGCGSRVVGRASWPRLLSRTRLGWLGEHSRGGAGGCASATRLVGALAVFLADGGSEDGRERAGAYRGGSWARMHRRCLSLCPGGRSASQGGCRWPYSSGVSPPRTLAALSLSRFVFDVGAVVVRPWWWWW